VLIVKEAQYGEEGAKDKRAAIDPRELGNWNLHSPKGV
jgi:hypothetical protein